MKLTNRNQSLRLVTISTIAVGSLLTASQSFAAPPAAKSPPTVTGHGDNGVLAGPQVEPEAQAKNGPGMMNKDGERKQSDLPFIQWIGLVRGLNLEPAQQTKIRTIAAEFTKAQKDYMEGLPENERAMMRKVRESRQNNQEPPAEARGTLKRIEDARPKPDAYQVRIWKELNESQQAQLKRKLDDLKAERTRRQAAKRESGENDSERPNDPSRMRGPKPGEGGAPAGKSDDAMMSPDGNQPDAMTTAADKPAGDQPNAAKRGKGKRLDAIGRRRAEFLLSHQAGNHINGQPTDAERTFKFDDDEAAPADAKPVNAKPSDSKPSGAKSPGG